MSVPPPRARRKRPIPRQYQRAGVVARASRKAVAVVELRK
jgi:hypothetical protein